MPFVWKRRCEDKLKLLRVAMGPALSIAICHGKNEASRQSTTEIGHRERGLVAFGSLGLVIPGASYGLTIAASHVFSIPG